MKFFGKISNQYQEAVYDSDSNHFQVQGACGMRLFVRPDQLASIVQWDNKLEINEQEVDVFLSLA
jgi:hypothetical protein